MTDRSKNVQTRPEQRRRGRPAKPLARESLVSAGLSAMHQHGYHATGVAEVVAQARAPKGLFYKHFASKQLFACAVVDAFADRLLENLALHLEDRREPSPIARLRGYFTARIAHYQANRCQRGCLLGNFGLELSDHDVEIRAQVAARFGELVDRIKRCLAAAQRKGEVRRDRSAAQLSRVVIAGWEGALLAMRVRQSVVPLREFFDVVIDDLLIEKRPSRRPLRN